MPNKKYNIFQNISTVLNDKIKTECYIQSATKNTIK